MEKSSNQNEFLFFCEVHDIQLTKDQLQEHLNSDQIHKISKKISLANYLMTMRRTFSKELIQFAKKKLKFSRYQ